MTTEDEGIIDFQPGFDNAAQSAIVTGALLREILLQWRGHSLRKKNPFCKSLVAGCTPGSVGQ